MTSSLPPHPEEARLRRGEIELAETLVELTNKVAVALRAHDRTTVVVLIAQLSATAEYGRRAMVRAIDDQMKVQQTS